MFLKNRIIIFKMKISKVTDYAALKKSLLLLMGIDARKPVYEVSDKVIIKPVSIATETT